MGLLKMSMAASAAKVKRLAIVFKHVLGLRGYGHAADRITQSDFDLASYLIHH